LRDYASILRAESRLGQIPSSNFSSKMDMTEAKPEKEKTAFIARRLTFLNAPILTAPGDYRYEPITLTAARDLVRDFHESGRTIQSAIGHASTAELMTTMLKYPVANNRIHFIQTPSDIALVFKLKQRAPEGVVLTRQEIEAIGYELGLLSRIDCEQPKKSELGNQ
jgi:hypothetical protein